MTSTAVDQAAAILLEAYRTGRPVPELPAACRPANVGEAYLIQDRVIAAIGPLGGWKVGAPSPDAPRHGAPLPASMIYRSPTVRPASEHRLFGIEAEIAFTFARDLPLREAPYSDEEIVDAIGSAHAAIEIIESRYVDMQATEQHSRLADNQNNGGLVLGPPVADWKPLDPAHAHLRLSVDGENFKEVTAGNKAGDPLSVLGWMVNVLARRSGGVHKGHVVTTGSWTGMDFFGPGVHVVADFGPLGAAEVTFAA